MERSIFSQKIGIIGGGQLGKMIINETNKWSLNISILDSNKNSPCKNLCDGFYVGALMVVALLVVALLIVALMVLVLMWVAMLVVALKVVT